MMDQLICSECGQIGSRCQCEIIGFKYIALDDTLRYNRYFN